MKIGIIGGTGNLGYGLALRWNQAGHSVIIGSREEAKAKEVAKQIHCVSGVKAEGLNNLQAVEIAELLVLSIPFKGQKEVLENLKPYVKDKIILDTTVPLTFKPYPRYEQPQAGSSGINVSLLLPEAVVISGLHTVSAALLSNLEAEIQCDALVCGDDSCAKKIIIALCQDIGIRSFDAGPLDNAQVLERLTPMIIGLNQKYKRRHIGVKLTGI